MFWWGPGLVGLPISGWERRHFGLILFLLLGFAAGVLNVLRSAGVVEQPQVGKRRKDNAEDDGSD